MVDGNLPYEALFFKMADGDAIHDFRFVFYEVLQNIPKTILGWKYIALFIGLFVLLQKNAYDYILTGEKVTPILDIMIICIRIL